MSSTASPPSSTTTTTTTTTTTSTKRKSTSHASSSSTRRMEQNKAAQAAFRERKRNHLMNLEKTIEELSHKVKQLQAENEQLRQARSCPSCVAAAAVKSSEPSPTPSAPAAGAAAAVHLWDTSKSDQDHGRGDKCDRDAASNLHTLAFVSIIGTSQTPMSPRQPRSQSPTTTSTSPPPPPKTTIPQFPYQQEPIQSAISLYGAPEVEFCRVGMKAIPSLKDSFALVDDMLLLFSKQSLDTDSSRIHRCQLIISALSQKLVNSCSIVDRQRVVEIFALFMAVNEKHLNHMYKISDSVYKPMEPVDENTYINLNDGLLRDEVPYAQRFAQMTKVNRKLIALCSTNTEELEKYMLALELAKFNNNSLMDKYLDEEIRKLRME
ncbi:hypothetical protein BDR26DRAFT_852345 [Obelidium mucronatum]|nr:hypothetical protein BDR26DRAFT_852345 [Obelidium mucronatum]